MIQHRFFFILVFIPSGLSEDEVSAQGILFFLAAYETSANTMSFMMYTLATKPDIQERLYQKIMQAVGDKVTDTP